jgi:hypothetical protein
MQGAEQMRGLPPSPTLFHDNSWLWSKESAGCLCLQHCQKERRDLFKCMTTCNETWTHLCAWKACAQKSSSAPSTEEVRATALQDNVGDIHADLVPSESTVTTGFYSSILSQRVRKSVTGRDQGSWQESFLSKPIPGRVHPKKKSNYSFGKFCNTPLIRRCNHVWSDVEINVKPRVSARWVFVNRCEGFVNSVWHIVNYLYTSIYFATCCSIVGHHQADSTFIVHLTVKDITTHWLTSAIWIYNVC